MEARVSHRSRQSTICLPSTHKSYQRRRQERCSSISAPILKNPQRKRSPKTMKKTSIERKRRMTSSWKIPTHLATLKKCTMLRKASTSVWLTYVIRPHKSRRCKTVESTITSLSANMLETKVCSNWPITMTSKLWPRVGTNLQPIRSSRISWTSLSWSAHLSWPLMILSQILSHIVKRSCLASIYSLLWSLSQKPWSRS